MKRIGVLVAAGCCAALSGCAAPSPSPEPVQLIEPLPIAPRAIGSLGGLEAYLWITEPGTAPAIEAVLDRGTLVRDENGLRTFELELLDVSRLRAAVRFAEAGQEAWLGQVPRWTVLIPGPVLDDREWISISGEPAPKSDGRLGLVVRAWTLPSPSGPRLQLELMPAVQGVAGFAPMRTAVWSGTLDPGRAWVIAGEAYVEPPPDAAPLPQGSDVGPDPDPVDDSGADQGSDPDTQVPIDEPSADPSPQTASESDGPPAAELPTPGELLMQRQAGRVLLVLVPRLPERVRLSE